MRRSLRTTVATAIAATAVLTAACGTSPLEPTAPAVGNRVNTGFSVAWGATGQPAPTDLHATGFSVAWGAKDQPPADAPQTGFSVAWGAKDSTVATGN